ncbi:MAG: universal stress protein [Promicromonosporaceae bacterium]|nr:universal stress protein [Promicromonosporaceae bacterium]
MDTTKPILVGVDGSISSRRALGWAALEAARLGVPLHVVSVCHGRGSSPAPMLPDEPAVTGELAGDHARAVRVLDDAVTWLVGRGVTADGSIHVGDAAGTLSRLSASHGLVVIGSRGRGGFDGRQLGSVSMALASHSHSPCVVVPTRAPSSARFGRALSNPDLDDDLGISRPRRVVVGVDGSPSSAAAVVEAIAQAELWDCEVLAVVGVPVRSRSELLSWLPESVDRIRLVRELAQRLDEGVAAVAAAHPGIRIEQSVQEGTGPEVLLRTTRESDLLVLGTRGRGGFRGLLLGSTSQTLLHHSVCPVITVPASEAAA